MAKLIPYVRCGYGPFSLCHYPRVACFAFTRSNTTVRECCYQALGIERIRCKRLQFLPDGDLICHSVPVVELIGLAYAIPENPIPRLASLPEWAVRQRFGIEAKTSASLKLGTKDIQAQRRTITILLQKLLTDHFGLVLNVKTVTTPIYALTYQATTRS